MSRASSPTFNWHSYSRLLRYALTDWRRWLLLVAVTLLTSAFGILQPWPMQVLVDHVLGDVPRWGPVAHALAMLPGGATRQGLLVWVVVAGLAVFGVNTALDVVLTRKWIMAGQGMVYRLAGDLFSHLQRRSLIFHSRNSVGDSISRITGDSWCVYKVVDTLFFTPKNALVTLVGILVVMLQMDVGLTLLSLAVAPLMAWSGFLMGNPIRRAAHARREVESRLQAHVHQTLSGIPVVQAFAQEEREQQRFQEFTNDAIQAQRRSTLVGSLSNLSSGMVITLGTGVVLWIGAERVLDGRLSVGTLLVFLAYLRTLQAQIKVLTGIYPALQETGASVDRVLQVLEAEPEIQDRPAAQPLAGVSGHIRLENVTFGYEPGTPVLKNVSLEVLPGQTVALVGATGAGKTTLASLVPRFFDPWQGRVLIDGQDVRDARLKTLREQVGLVLQEPFLFPLTIAENIAFGRPGATEAEIEAAARTANIHDFIRKLPLGYQTILGERGATLSGGERQRLSIARALLKNAPILILDEPTSALDAATERLLLHAVESLMRGRTTVVIAHRLSTIRNADRIVVLSDGEIAESGTHRELLARDGLYARLHQLQSGERPERPLTTSMVG